MTVRRLARLYTPVVCLITLLLLNLWSEGASFDPLTAAQNPRLQFQTDQLPRQPNTNLSSTELRLSEDVINPSADWGGGVPRILYFGNSQTMAIMDRLPGDLTSPQWFQVLLSRQADGGAWPVVRLGSLPNLTMTEFLIKLVAAGESPSGGPDIVVLGLVLDGWRSLGIREDLNPVARSPRVASALSSLVKTNPDLRLADSVITPLWQSTSEPQQTSTEKSSSELPATRIEASLQNWAAGHVSLFAARSALQGQVFLRFFSMRNALLGINTSTARPIPEADYLTSRELFELSLRYARSNGIHMIVYFAPIRPIQPNPNVPENVARFRRDIPTLCQEYGATCLDYTDLIPEELWTNYPDDAAGAAGQRDFAHFTGAAHKRLAEQLMTDVGPFIKRWKYPAQQETRQP